MRTAGVAALAHSLATIEAPETLSSLAATARALSTDARVGALWTTSAMLSSLVQVTDDALDPHTWDQVQAICARLAEFLGSREVSRLDAVGVAWLDLARPSALQ